MNIFTDIGLGIVTVAVLFAVGFLVMIVYISVANLFKTATVQKSLVKAGQPKIQTFKDWFKLYYFLIDCDHLELETGQVIYRKQKKVKK